MSTGAHDQVPDGFIGLGAHQEGAIHLECGHSRDAQFMRTLPILVHLRFVPAFDQYLFGSIRVERGCDGKLLPWAK